MSHVAILDVPSYHKLLYVTDGGMVVAPDLEQKRHILQNAVDFCRFLGYDRPKAAALCAVETVTPSMPETADAAALKVAKAAISGVVPVVGSILSEATETVLAGAGMLKNTIGVFGMLGILAACAHPFLQLGVQYLLYKLTAFLASTVGPPGLCKLIDGLGGAFGLVLGMTGSCAFLLLISVLSSVAAVAP